MVAPSFAHLDLNLLHALQALLLERHVSRAAQRVDVSQSAMSKSLSKLRVVFDDPLLVRRGSGYELTARAEELLGPLEEAMGVLQRAVYERPVFDPASTRRTFRIAASSTTAFVALESLVPAVAEHYPGITFAVLPIDRSADLMTSERGADLVLLPSVLPTRLPRERLYDDDWVIVCAEDDTRYGAAISTAELASAPRAVFEEHGLRTHGELMLQSLTPDTARVTAPDFMTVLHLISGSRLIAVVQGRVARRLGPQNGLRILEAPVSLPGFGMDMVWSRPPRTDPALAWLRRTLITALDDGRAPPGSSAP